MPTWVSFSFSLTAALTARAMPKSASSAWPPSSRMFSGLMSRWITPRPWAYCSASATSRVMRSASSRGSCFSRSSRCAQRFAFHVRHHVVEAGLVLAGIVERQDMRVVERGGGLDLGEEAVHADGGGELGAQDLDGDRAVVLQVLGPGRRWPCRPGRFPARCGSGRRGPRSRRSSVDGMGRESSRAGRGCASTRRMDRASAAAGLLRPAVPALGSGAEFERQGGLVGQLLDRPALRAGQHPVERRRVAPPPRRGCGRATGPGPRTHPRRRDAGCRCPPPRPWCTPSRPRPGSPYPRTVPPQASVGAPSSIPTSSVRTIVGRPAAGQPDVPVAIAMIAARLSASASSRLWSKSAAVRAAPVPGPRWRAHGCWP